VGLTDRRNIWSTQRRLDRRFRLQFAVRFALFRSLAEQLDFAAMLEAGHR
jgi:hypothetical protein